MTTRPVSPPRARYALLAACLLPSAVLPEAMSGVCYLAFGVGCWMAFLWSQE